MKREFVGKFRASFFVKKEHIAEEILNTQVSFSFLYNIITNDYRESIQKKCTKLTTMRVRRESFKCRSLRLQFCAKNTLSTYTDCSCKLREKHTTFIHKRSLN